jgi:hypothetical protein
MIFSQQQLFQNGAVTSTGYSTNTIDLRASGRVLKASADLVREIGKGRPIPIVVQVTAVAGTNPTLTVALRQSDAENMGTPDTLVTATQVTGAGRVALYVLPEHITKRYIALHFTIGGTDAPSFTTHAFIALADQQGVIAGRSG